MKSKLATLARIISSGVCTVSLLALGAGCATAQTEKPSAHPTGGGFSFAVYGDSRSMMYLPYWMGAAPKEEYNYLLVDVQPGQPTKFTLNRFRPWSAEPFATVELFK